MIKEKFDYRSTICVMPSCFALAMLEGGFFREEAADSGGHMSWGKGEIRELSDLNDPEYKRDFQLFPLVIAFMEEVMNAKDGEKRLISDRNLFKLSQLITSSVLFAAMGSKEIIVTERHKHITPRAHTFRVLRLLQWGENQKEFFKSTSIRWPLVLSIVALYHDVGKAMSVGYDLQELDKRMEEQEPKADDSYRGHDEVSRSVVATIMVHSEISLTNHEKVIILFLIKHHHIFSGLSWGHISLDEVAEMLEAFTTELEGSGVTARHLLRMLHDFSEVDVRSIDGDEMARWLQQLSELTNGLSNIVGDIGLELNSSMI